MHSKSGIINYSHRAVRSVTRWIWSRYPIFLFADSGDFGGLYLATLILGWFPDHQIPSLSQYLMVQSQKTSPGLYQRLTNCQLVFLLLENKENALHTCQVAGWEQRNTYQFPQINWSKKQPAETHKKRKPLQTPPWLGPHCAPFLYANCEQTCQAEMLTRAWLEPFSSSKPRKRTTVLLLIQMDTWGPTSLKKTQHWDSLASPAVLGPVWAPSGRKPGGEEAREKNILQVPPVEGGVRQVTPGEPHHLTSSHSTHCRNRLTNSGSQSGVPGPTASAPPGDLWEIRFSGPSPDLLNQQLCG